MKESSSPLASSDPSVKVATNGEKEYVVVYRADEDILKLRRSSILKGQYSAAELGVLIYTLGYASLFRDQLPSVFNVLKHFEADKPLDILYAMKGLVAKGLLEDSQELNEAVFEMLREKNQSENS